MLKCGVTSNKMELFEKQNHDEFGQQSDQLHFITMTLILKDVQMWCDQLWIWGTSGEPTPHSNKEGGQNELRPAFPRLVISCWHLTQCGKVRKSSATQFIHLSFQQHEGQQQANTYPVIMAYISLVRSWGVEIKNDLT